MRVGLVPFALLLLTPLFANLPRAVLVLGVLEGIVFAIGVPLVVAMAGVVRPATAELNLAQGIETFFGTGQASVDWSIVFPDRARDRFPASIR